MKKLFALTAIAVLIFTISSCEKDEGKLPNIAFKTGGKYVSADKIVGQGDTVTIGIDASKSEDKDVLKTFDGSRGFDGAAPTSFITETLTGNNENAFSKDIDLIMRNQAGTEAYFFTVVNRDGLKNTVKLKLTVQ